MRSRFSIAVIAAAVVVADQATKGMVAARIPLGAVVPVVPRFFNLVHTTNSGVVFGLFAESPAAWKTALLVIGSVVLLGVLVMAALRSPHLAWQTQVSLALMFGGALANLFDRVRTGVVVDFLDFYIRTYHWPAFNVADSAIVIGSGLMAFHLLFVG